MSDTWIDISHIRGWSGVLSGIERVEFHIIQHYFNATNARFMSWDNESSIFAEVPRTEVESEILNRSSESELVSKQVLSPRRKLRRGLKVLVKKRTKKSTTFFSGKVIILAGLWDNESYIKATQELAKTTKIVHVVYDMIPLVQPGFVVEFLPKVFSNYMLRVLPVCSKVMAISEASRQDVISILKENKLNVPEVIAFRLGDDLTRAPQAIKPEDAPSKFVLSVSTIEARKNHMLLYYVIKLAKSKNISLPTFVIAGRRGWLTGDFQYLLEHDPDAKKSIKLLDSVSDANLRWLYENCMLTIFPSFYEGWGLPVAESLNYGKVTLATDKSSVPEVGGEVVDYFSPYSAEELLNLILNYKDDSQRHSREDQIRNTYKPIKWQLAASKFASLVQQ